MSLSVSSSTCPNSHYETLAIQTMNNTSGMFEIVPCTFAISDSIFLAYPDLRPGQLSLLRSANISTEKLARAAVKHGLYKYVRHNAAPLDEKVRDFTLAVQQEADTVVHGGMVKAPKVLADIVEAVAAAVYADPQFDLQAFWVCLSSTGEEGRTEGKCQVACRKAGLEKLSHSNSEDKMNVDIYSSMNGTNEIEGAKQKMHEICGKKRWPKPTYWIVKEEGPSHERKFLCSVQVETVECVLFAEGDERSKVKDAENSAASSLIHGLQESKFI
ncbi:unnamed protein product [Camellia sinensis]